MVCEDCDLYYRLAYLCTPHAHSSKITITASHARLPFHAFTNVFISQALIRLFAQAPDLKQHYPKAPNITGTGVRAVVEGLEERGERDVT